jgi:hypothetical protein
MDNYGTASQHMIKFILNRGSAMALISLVCAGLAVTSGVLASREFAASVSGAPRGSSAIMFWVSPPEPFPIDAGGRQQRRLMASCLAIVAGQDFAFHDAGVRSAVATNCAEQARYAMASGTVIAEAAALLAVESIDRGNLAQAETFLSQSHAMAPTDLGMVLVRIGIGFQAFSADVMAGPGGILEREMPVLIGSGRGVAAAASLYVQVPELRPVVDRIADALPAIDRQRFLRALERRVNG